MLDRNRPGLASPELRYCHGEGYMFRESIVKMAVFRGLAPVYKPGVQATGQYPGSDWGYSDPDRATAFCEYTVFPDYERYTLQTNPAFDKLYELKVDSDGQTVRPIIRSSKWKVMNVSPIHGDNGGVKYFEIAYRPRIPLSPALCHLPHPLPSTPL